LHLLLRQEDRDILNRPLHEDAMLHRFLASTALLFGLFLAADVRGHEPKATPKPAEATRDIDVVLCLDLSGSMTGLVDSAKSRLWDIVNELAKAKPTPRLRVGLYSYGHSANCSKSGWVRCEIDLTPDLDLLYQKLFALKIAGADELVTRATRAAAIEQKWSEQKDALKIIFVAGNEPADQDKVVSLKEAAAAALAKGIIINPIYCGAADHGDAKTWRELAVLAHGRFTNIDQNHKVAIVTPVDKDLAGLAEKLNSTYVAYGKHHWKARNQEEQTKNARDAGLAVTASRVTYQNSALYQCDEWDLVDRCRKDPKFDITKIADEDLTPELKKLTPEQRVALVKEMGEKRIAMQKQIEELTAKRDLFLREETKRNPNPALRAFDQAIRETLQIQGKAKGIVIPE
jgi:hypothetical protein